MTPSSKLNILRDKDRGEKGFLIPSSDSMSTTPLLPSPLKEGGGSCPSEEEEKMCFATWCVIFQSLIVKSCPDVSLRKPHGLQKDN